jgi:hypothetical protein
VEGLTIQLANLRVRNRHSIFRHKARSPPCVNASLLDKSQVTHGYEVWAPRCKRRRQADPRRRGWAALTSCLFQSYGHSSDHVLTIHSVLKLISSALRRLNFLTSFYSNYGQGQKAREHYRSTASKRSRWPRSMAIAYRIHSRILEWCHWYGQLLAIPIHGLQQSWATMVHTLPARTLPIGDPGSGSRTCRR